MFEIFQFGPVLLFFLLFVAVVITEVKWLERKGWAISGRAVGYVLTTDLLALCIGSFVVFVILFIMFMMVMGPAGRGSNIPNAAYVAISLVAIIVPPIILILIKRLFLLVFKLASGKAAWSYSVASSFLFILIALLPPPLLFVLIAYLSSWK